MGEHKGVTRFVAFSPTVPSLVEIPAKTFCSVATYTLLAVTTAVFTWPTYFLCQLLMPTWSSYIADAVPSSSTSAARRVSGRRIAPDGSPITFSLWATGLQPGFFSPTTPSLLETRPLMSFMNGMRVARGQRKSARQANPKSSPQPGLLACSCSRDTIETTTLGTEANLIWCTKGERSKFYNFCNF